MKNRDTKTDGKIISSCTIELQKFEDGTIRPFVTMKGMWWYEVIGMLELVKMEAAQKSWDKADQIRKEKTK